MEYLKKFKLFESKLKYNKRDITNKYSTEDGYINYLTDIDDYDIIDKEFDITWDHIGWILKDFIEDFDLLYNCMACDQNGVGKSHKESGPIDHIRINFIPAKSKPTDNLRKYIFMIQNNYSKAIKYLIDIESKLDENFPWLTIKKNGWSFYTTSSQILLKIERNQ